MEQPLRDRQTDLQQEIVREHQPVRGTIQVSARQTRSGLMRITIRLQNLSGAAAGSNRESSLLYSLVSAHKILSVRGAEFVSLIDPPQFCREDAEKCVNVGTWPVLAGEDSQRDVMLSSPIILYDFPQIAPESAGDLCDGTEIDEILSLRILTLTDAEKLEVRNGDSRARQILERTEMLPPEHFQKLHGALRGLRPNPEAQ